MSFSLHAMRKVLLLLAALVGGAAVTLAAVQPEGDPAAPDQGAAAARSPRFGFVDIFIDSADTPLAVYQVELHATAGDVRIVGVEGGDARAFAEPPRYDPAALASGERIILGAFSTQPDLPVGRTRIARVHLRIEGPAPALALVLEVAGDVEGNSIHATASYEASFQTQNGSNP